MCFSLRACAGTAGESSESGVCCNRHCLCVCVCVCVLSECRFSHGPSGEALPLSPTNSVSSGGVAGSPHRDTRGGGNLSVSSAGEPTHSLHPCLCLALIAAVCAVCVCVGRIRRRRPAPAASSARGRAGAARPSRLLHRRGVRGHR